MTQIAVNVMLLGQLFNFVIRVIFPTLLSIIIPLICLQPSALAVGLPIPKQINNPITIENQKNGTQIGS